MIAALRRRHARLAGAAEDGRILVLGLGLTVVLLAVVLVVSAVTAIHLDRKRMLATADATAAAVADAIADQAYYEHRFDELLTDELVRSGAEEYLARTDLSGLDGVRELALGEPTGTPDGRTAVVTLVATIDPPFVPALGAVVPVRVTVTGRAQAFDVVSGP